MSISECYKVLEVHPNCSDEELKSAYRKMARKWHPDVNKEENATDKFKEVTNAYDSVRMFRRSRKNLQYDPINSIFGNIFTVRNFWNFSEHANAGSVRVELEFESLPKQDSERLFEILKKEGFNIRRSSVIYG